MAWKVTTPKVGYPNVQATDTVQAFPLGTIITAVDPEYGEAEFMYLKGVANTVVGDIVIYDLFAKTTTRCPATGGIGPIAVAMSANVASQYGWYQISGAAVIRANAAISAGAVLYMAATGAVDDAVVAGEDLKSAISLTAAGASLSSRTASTVNGSDLVTVSGLDGLFVGATVSGTGIPGSTTISAIGPWGGLYSNQIKLSAAATASGSITLSTAITNYVLGSIQRPYIV